MTVTARALINYPLLVCKRIWTYRELACSLSNYPCINACAVCYDCYSLCIDKLYPLVMTRLYRALQSVSAYPFLKSLDIPSGLLFFYLKIECTVYLTVLELSKPIISAFLWYTE